MIEATFSSFYNLNPLFIIKSFYLKKKQSNFEGPDSLQTSLSQPSFGELSPHGSKMMFSEKIQYWVYDTYIALI